MRCAQGGKNTLGVIEVLQAADAMIHPPQLRCKRPTNANVHIVVKCMSAPNAADPYSRTASETLLISTGMGTVEDKGLRVSIGNVQYDVAHIPFQNDLLLLWFQ